MPSRMLPFLDRFVQTNLLPDLISCTLCIPALFGIGVVQFLVQAPQAPWFLFPSDTALPSTVWLLPFSHLVWSTQFTVASWLRKHVEVLFFAITLCLNYPQMITHTCLSLLLLLFMRSSPNWDSAYSYSPLKPAFLSQMSGWSSDILVTVQRPRIWKMPLFIQQWR